MKNSIDEFNLFIKRDCEALSVKLEKFYNNKEYAQCLKIAQSKFRHLATLMLISIANNKSHAQKLVTNTLKNQTFILNIYLRNLKPPWFSVSTEFQLAYNLALFFYNFDKLDSLDDEPIDSATKQFSIKFLDCFNTYINHVCENEEKPNITLHIAQNSTKLDMKIQEDINNYLVRACENLSSFADHSNPEEGKQTS